eukprot:TRINITY_DN683_c0_g2_i9.p1 TRINITY_DN683_c0_g2~~TRINITY_DN683_c0_g2_i9.p1  ORF type:complete len:144 (-),score=22.32 TRINITY_DN683_c0_g2_i9:927-1358(-)
MEFGSSWIEAFCVVQLDLERGLVVERSYPEDALSREDLASVAMLSFPESSGSNQDEEQSFFFRFRLNQAKSSLKATSKQFLFGFSYYVQRKDSSNPRGYFQKAFVIITKYYFSFFYRSLAFIAGSAYFHSPVPSFLQVPLPHP